MENKLSLVSLEEQKYNDRSGKNGKSEKIIARLFGRAKSMQ